MNKTFTFCVLGSLLLCLSCKNRSERNKGVAEIKQNDTYEYFVAPVAPRNTRNSEAAIVPIKDGSLLLAWTGFYAGNGADHGPARISGKISTDGGHTWRDGQHVKPAGGECYENACIELKDGKVLMLMRTSLGGQFKSISSDGGESWSDPLITPLAGTAAPVSISRIPKTGDLLAIWTHNPDAQKRNPLTSAISKDEGETWEHFRNLEDAPDDAWAYPAVTWIENRALITYFNYKGGLSLKLKSLPVEWFYQ